MNFVSNRCQAMEDDDDLWGPPLVVQDDAFRKQTVRGCEFWFDCRTDVLEENFQNERYCEQVLLILNEKKHDVNIDKLEKGYVLLQNEMVSSETDDDAHGVGSSDSDKTLSDIPSADSSSAKSVFDEDEITSSISNVETIETRDSSNEDKVRGLKPAETAANDPVSVEVTEDADTSSCHVLQIKSEEVEEHSCSSLVTDLVIDPIKQAHESKSSSAVSGENIGGSTLRPLLLETREVLREKANAIEDYGARLKDHQQSHSLQNIVTASGPFTTESLLEMCDQLDKGREAPCDDRSNKSLAEAVKTVGKDKLAINLLSDVRKKAESNNALLKPGSALIKKRQRQSNTSDDKGVNTSFIRKIKQKVQCGAGKINTDPVKNSAKPTPEIIRGSSSVPTQDADSLSSEDTVSDSVISLSTNELKTKTGKELRSIAKELKVTHYYKLKKEDLLQRLTSQLDDPGLRIVQSREGVITDHTGIVNIRP